MKNLLYSTTQVGSTDWHRLNKNPCEICDTTESGCLIGGNGDAWICTKVSSENETKVGWLHYSKEKKYHPIEIKQEKEVVEMAHPKARNAAYKWLKKKYPLSKEHKQYLKRNGVTDTKRYFSLPRPMDERYWSIDTQTEFPEGIPGFFQISRYQKINCYYWGMACLQVDTEGRYVGVEIRLDEDCKKIRGIKDFKSIYRPFVSGKLPGGASLQEFITVFGKNDTETVIFTEGGKKGEIAHAFYDCTVVAVKGVSNYQAVADVAKELKRKSPKVRNLVVAFDIDKETNQHVMSAFTKLVSALSEIENVNIFDARWESPRYEYYKIKNKLQRFNYEYKGIDDAILGKIPVEFVELKKSEYITLDECREQMPKDIHQLLTKPNGMFNLIKSTPGAGKTFSVTEVVNKLKKEGWPTNDEGKKLRISFSFANNHLVREKRDDLDFKILPLEGRSDKEDSPFYCAQKELVNHVAGAGKNSFSNVCMTCTLRNDCSYLKTTKLVMKEDFIITNHAALFNKSSRINDVDIIVCDESVRDWIVDEDVITVQDITNAIAAHDRLLNQIERMDIFEVSNFFPSNGSKSSGQIRDEYLSRYTEHIAELERIRGILINHAGQYAKIEVTDFSDITVPDMIEWSHERMPQGVVGQRSARGWEVYPKTIIEHKSEKDRYVMPPDSVSDEPYLLVRSFKEHIFEALQGKTIINLDATPLDSFIEVFEPFGINRIEYKVREHILVKSISNVKMTKAQMENPFYRDQAKNTVEYLNKKHNGNLAVISTKAFIEEVIDQGIVEEDKTCYYGKDTRGSNRLKDTEAGVMPGVYIENLGSIQRDVDLLRRTGVKTDLGRLTKEITAAEMRQGVARGRPILRTEDNPYVVYKLTSENIGFVEDEYYSSMLDMCLGVKSPERRKISRIIRDGIYNDTTEFDWAFKSWGDLLGREVSKPMIAENEPQYDDLFYKIKDGPAKGGSFLENQWEKLVLPSFNSLLGFVTDLGPRLKGISQKRWNEFLNSVSNGLYSVSDQVRYLKCSESTVKRLRRVLIDLFASFKSVGDLSLSKYLEKGEENKIQPIPDAVELLDYTYEHHMDELMDTYREQIPDDFIGEFFPIVMERDFANIDNPTNAKELKSAMELFKECPGEEGSVLYFWTMYSMALPDNAAMFIMKNLAHIYLEYRLKGIESDADQEEKQNASAQAENQEAEDLVPF